MTDLSAFAPIGIIGAVAVIAALILWPWLQRRR
jgi:hypothetical protein